MVAPILSLLKSIILCMKTRQLPALLFLIQISESCLLTSHCTANRPEVIKPRIFIGRAEKLSTNENTWLPCYLFVSHYSYTKQVVILDKVAQTSPRLPDRIYLGCEDLLQYEGSFHGDFKQVDFISHYQANSQIQKLTEISYLKV